MLVPRITGTYQSAENRVQRTQVLNSDGILEARGRATCKPDEWSPRGPNTKHNLKEDCVYLGVLDYLEGPEHAGMARV